MKTSFLKLTLCVLTLTRIQGGPFHCMRLSQECPPGATCNENGTCTCPSHLQGDDCSIVKGDITKTGCAALKCKNGGVCVKKGTNVVCACPVNYYGKDCSEKRYQIKCYSDEMIFNVNPVGQFHGFASVVWKGQVQECRSSPLTTPINDDRIPSTWEGHVLRLKFKNSKCGNIDPVEKKDKSKEFEATVLVRYEQRLITYLDDRFLGTCVWNPFVFVSVGVGFKIKEEVKPTTPPDTGAAGLLRGYFLSCAFALLICWIGHTSL